MANNLKINFLTTCDLASVTREGKVNMMGIFSQVFVRKLPSNYLKFSIVAFLKGKENSHNELQLKLINPDKKELINQKVKIQIGAQGTANMFFEVVNLPLEKPGEYQISLADGKKTLSTHQLRVVIMKPPQNQGMVN